MCVQLDGLDNLFRYNYLFTMIVEITDFKMIDEVCR